jgi:predicted transcriptional regulator
MKVSNNAGKVLGELEKSIMDVLWAQGALSVRELMSFLHSEKKPAYTTIMTVMNRLVEKGLLNRTMVENAYVYKPKVKKVAFISQAINSILSNTVSSLGDEALAHFVKEVESIDPEKKKKLLALLDEK